MMGCDMKVKEYRLFIYIAVKFLVNFAAKCGWKQTKPFSIMDSLWSAEARQIVRL